MAKKVIFELDLEGKNFISTATEMKKKIIELEKKQKLLARTTDGKTSKAFQQNAAVLKDLKNDYNNVQKAMIDYNRQQVSTVQYTKTVNKELNRKINTINEANQQITRLNKIKKSLNINNDKEKALLDKINKKIDKNTNFVKANSSAVEKQKMNIGNYASAFDGLSPRLAGFMRDGYRVVEAMKAQRVAISASNKSLKLFKIALISTGIGAIVVLLGSLVAAFASTQKGIDAVSSVLTPLRVLFESLFGVVQDFGSALIESFKSPKIYIKKLLDALAPLGKVLQGIATLNFSLVKEGFNEMKDQAVNAYEKLSKFTSEALERGKQIDQLNKEISKRESEIATKRAKNLDIIKQQELISKDQTKSEKERLKAIDIAAKATKENLNLENEIIRLKVKKLKLDQKSNDTSRDEYKELNELEAKLIENQTKARAIEMRFLGVKNSLIKKNATESKRIYQETQRQQRKELENDIRNAEIELNIYKEKNKSKLESDVRLSDEVVKARLSILETIKTKERLILDDKLKNGLIKENEYNLAKLQLNNDFLEKEKELNKQFKDEQEAERQAELQKQREERQKEFELQLEENSIKRQTEYERKIEEEQLQYENDLAILEERLLTKVITQEEHDRRLAILKQKHIDKIKEIELKKEKFDEQLRYRAEMAELTQAKRSLGLVKEVFGEASTVGKAFAVAEATTDAIQAAMKAFKTAQDSPITVVNPSYPYIQAGLAAAFGAVQVAKVAGVKFEKGGLMEIGGKRHAQGGTVFTGTDGTVFEAEQGELIGVMSRQASEKFKAFNDLYTSGISDSNYMANGGLIEVSSATTNITKGFNEDSFANIIADKINDIKVAVPVLDVQDTLNEHNEIIANSII